MNAAQSTLISLTRVAEIKKAQSPYLMIAPFLVYCNKAKRLVEAIYVSRQLLSLDLESCGLAFEVLEVVELGPSDYALAHDLYRLDGRGV